jgi:ribonuclease HI
VILNTGDPTHFSTQHGSFSTIDLSFTTPENATTYTWEPLDDLHDSDHYPIKIETHPEQTIIHQTTQQWNFKRANWTEYQNYIDQNCYPILEYTDPETQVQQFTKIMIDAAELNIGYTQQRHRHNPVPWWNDDCETTTRVSKKALYRYKKHKSQQNLIALKQARAKARITIKKRKQQAWEDYISTLTTNTPTSEIWKTIHKIQGKKRFYKITALNQSNGTLTTDEIQMANILGEQYQKASSDNHYSKDFLKHKQKSENLPLQYDSNDNGNPINHEFTPTEMQTAMNRPRASSAGPDNIPDLLIKNLTPKAQGVVLKIFNNIWQQQKFPDIWRKAIIIPVFKPGKQKTEANSYRPISLTCTLCKLLERMVNARLMWYMEDKSLLHNAQNGFRPNRSTLDSILLLHTEACHALANRQEMLTAFIDIEKAFDTVWRYNVLKKLTDWKVTGNMLQFLRNFMENRTFQVRINGKLSNTFHQTNGIPQGSVLSSTLFLVAINSLPGIIPKPVVASIYADDLIIFCRGSQITTTQKIIQNSLQIIEKWSAETGFRCSTTKTTIMRFSRRRNKEALEPLQLYGQPLTQVQHQTYLGITFDSRLTFSTHITTLKNDCLRRLNLLKAIAHTNWGSDERTILRTYRATIRSKLDYGSPAYGSATRSQLRKLDTIQNTALRLALGAFRTSPALSLHRESNETPLPLRRKQLTHTQKLKVLTLRSHPLHNKVTTNPYSEKYAANATTPKPFFHDTQPTTDILKKLFPTPTAPYPPWRYKTPKTNLTILTHTKKPTNPAQIQIQLDTILEAHTHDIVIYTDASKTHEGVGCAFYSPQNATERKLKLSNESSIHTAELYAIHQALYYSQTLDQKNIIICTDSLSAIQAIRRISPKNHLLHLIQKTLYETEKQDKSILFVWIPSHCNLQGNDKADQAARDAIQAGQETQESLLLTDAISIIKRSIHADWETQWKNTNTKLRHIAPDLQPKSHKELTRRESVILRRLRIGHTALTHKHLLERSNTPTCRRCNTPTTVKHILLDCPNLQHHREKNQLANNMTTILNTEPKHVIQYIRDCEIYHLL